MLECSKAAVHRPFIPLQKEGRERWTLVFTWHESKPTKWRVCFSLCADWWNELWVWEIDSGRGWSPSLPFLACVHSALIPSFLPCCSPVGSSHLFSLTNIEGSSQNGGKKQHKQGGISCSRCPLLSDWKSRGTGEAVASFLPFLCLFHFTC